MTDFDALLDSLAIRWSRSAAESIGEAERLAEEAGRRLANLPDADRSRAEAEYENRIGALIDRAARDAHRSDLALEGVLAYDHRDLADPGWMQQFGDPWQQAVDAGRHARVEDLGAGYLVADDDDGEEA